MDNELTTPQAHAFVRVPDAPKRQTAIQQVPKKSKAFRKLTFENKENGE